MRVSSPAAFDHVLDRAFKSTADGFLRIDSGGAIRHANASAAALGGLSPEEAPGRSLATLHPALSRDSVAEALRTCREDQIEVEVETELESSSGLLSLRLFPCGEDVCVVLTRSDEHPFSEIDERPQPAEEREAFLNRVLDTLFTFVGVLLPDGTLVEANRTPLAAAEIELEDVYGTKFWDCYWWNYDPAVRERLRTACEKAADGEVVRYDVAARMAGDTRVWIDFQVAPLRDERGRITHLIPSAMDITARRQAEEELRQQQRQFTTMANSIPQLAWMADHEGWIFWYNDRWFSYTGTTLDEMEGWGWRSVHHPEHVDRVVERFKRSVESGDAWEDIFPLRSADGEYRWFLSRALPIRDDEGRVVRWFGTNTDITEQLQIEEELRRSQKKLRELNQTLERRVVERTAQLEYRNKELQHFAHIASHDLREPLRKIQSFADLLRDACSERLDDEEQFFLDRMQSSAERMDGLLRDLLSFSRVSSHASPFRMVHLEEVVSDVLSGYDLAIHEKGAEVDVDVAVRIDADRSQLRQLLTNLVGNALKYTRDEVTPRVSIRAETFTRDGEKPESAPASWCRLVVEDNGIGIEERYAERVFEPFERLHGNQRYEGTGMGLAISRRIVQRHGGSIAVESVPGEGSRFIVELPVDHSVRADEPEGVDAD